MGAPPRTAPQAAGGDRSRVLRALEDRAVTAELLSLHDTVHRGVTTVVASPDDHFSPGHWVPHCTLTTALDPDLVAKTWALLPRAAMPLHGRLEQLGIVEFPPARELFVCDLGSGGRQP